MKTNLMSITVAVDDNGVIAQDGEIPWRCPVDLEMFRRMSFMASKCIVGRKTYENIHNILKHRAVQVLSREKVLAQHASHYDARSLEHSPGSLVIGGAQIYQLALTQEVIDKIYMTQIPLKTQGEQTTFFPQIGSEWKKTRSRSIETDVWGQDGEHHFLPVEFIELINTNTTRVNNDEKE